MAAPALNRSRAGQTDTNPAGPEAIQVTIRHIAASNVVPSDGNKESVAPAPSPPENTVKTPAAPVKRSSEKNPMRTEPQGTYAQEPWVKAAGKARKMFRGE